MIRLWTLALLVAVAGVPARAEDTRPGPLPGARAVAAAPAPAPSGPVATEYDPWQGCNRKIFSFNDTLDEWVLEPVAKGWDFITPKPVEHGISNFFGNLRFPIDLVNNLLQGKGVGGAKTLGRFAINTTLGAGGFLDPASQLGLGPQTEDFGQTLGVWGVGPGPYLVLPLLGPSSLRDAPALGVDAVTAITPFFIDSWILVGARVVDVVNTRAQFLKEVADAKAASLDFYVFVRNAYLQRRQALIEDRGKREIPERIPTYEDEELYTVP
jgi:phospholipid-binding lipoprotein MlaA